MIEERYLVAAALAGRPEAYDELVRRYRGAVTTVAWRVLGCAESAQDVAQEAFVIAFEQLAQLKDPRRFGPWVRVIAQNHARAVARREEKLEPVSASRLEWLGGLDGSAGTDGPLLELVEKEQNRAIRDLVRGLAPGIQTVVELYYREQWSVGLIAEFLSLTKTTVKWRLHTGRRQLSSLLRELVCDDGSPTAPGPGSDHNFSKGEVNHG